MLRTLNAVLCLFVLTAVLPAQSAEDREFLTEFGKSMEFKDERTLDKAMRKLAASAMRHYQDLRIEIALFKKDLSDKTDWLRAGWTRVFENAEVLDRLDRWVDALDQPSYESYRKVRDNQIRVWSHYLTESGKDGTKRPPFESARDQLLEVARMMEATGHKIDTAETYALVSVILSRIPDRSQQDRKDTIFALERFVENRDAWAWKGDPYYGQNAGYLKGQRAELETNEKAGAKREAEGYDKNAKGIDLLVKSDVPEATHELQFATLADFETDLDYSQKGGPLPQYWWTVPFGKDTTDLKINWFRRLDLHLLRQGALKFAVSTNPAEPKLAQPVEVAGKAKASKFFLDAEHKVPYAMFFWVGSDQDRMGEMQVNLSPTTDNTGVYYRSAASWQVDVGGETLWFYDDNTSGLPMDPDPLDGKFPTFTLGSGNATAVATPLLDSMKVGKGARVPFSQFVKVGEAWWYVRRTEKNALGARPLNPAYFKTGKVKLVWKGPKPTAPVQLVIQGSGDFATACYDIASGKEIEVPVGDYKVIWGRLLQGKAAQAKMATVYGGVSQPFSVAEGKVAAVEMGAPFRLEFRRDGTDSEVKIDGTSVIVTDVSGLTITEMHGMSLQLDAMAAKRADGKGARAIGKFQKFTDSELVRKVVEKMPNIGMLAACFPIAEGAAAGTMELVAKLPEAGWKVQLSCKKHALFGKMDSDWK